MKIRVILVLAFISTAFSLFAQAPKWKVELSDPVKINDFVGKGKYLFLANKEYAWCFDAATGTKKWETEIDDFNSKGPQRLIGDLYVVAVDDKLTGYDALTGKVKWQREYSDISQDDYTDLSFLDDVCVIRYGSTHIGVDLATGKENWRQEISYNQKVLEKGGYNFVVRKKQGKMMVFDNDENLNVYDIRTGKLLATFGNSEPEYDVVKAGKEWVYEDSTERYNLILMDGFTSLIDLDRNREVIRHEMDIDEDRLFVLPTKQGMAVMGKDQVAHFRFASGKVNNVPIDVSSYRSFFSFTVNGTDLAFFSQEDGGFVVDVTNEKLLWKNEDIPELNDGYAHRLVGMDGENAIFTIAVSSLAKRNRLQVASINLLTGKVNYSHYVARSENYIPGIGRTMVGISKALSGEAGAQSNSTNRGMRIIDDSYDNIGISYEYFDYNGNIVIALRTKANMQNPETGDRGGEGFFAFEPKTGKVAYKDYFRCSDEGSGGMEPKVVAPQGNVVSNGKGIVFMPGEDKIIAFDLNSGKRLWTQDKLEAKPTSLALIDGTIYAQLGAQDYDVLLEKNSIKFKEYNEDEPFGYAAIDPKDGKILWRIELPMASGVNMPDFSIINYYNPKTKQLYLSDDEKLYALKLTSDSKGAFDWVIELEKSKIGEMPYKKTYAVTETYIGSRPRSYTSSTYLGGGYTLETTTTYGGIEPDKQMEFLDEAGSAELTTVYTSFWGNIWGVSARRCLRIIAANGKIFAMGTKGAVYLEASTGKPIWEHEWEYDYEAVDYVPRIIGNNLVYCMDRKLACVDMTTGKEKWSVKEGKKSKFFLSEDEKSMFSINEEVVSGYELK